MPPNRNNEHLVFAAIFSVFLLMVLSLIGKKDPDYLAIQSHWIAYSLLPLALVLIAGRWINRLKFMGIEFENKLESPISQEPDAMEFAKLRRYPPDGTAVDKASVSALPGFAGNPDDVLFLRFNLEIEYDHHAILEHLKFFHNVRFFELYQSEGEFIGYFPSGYYPRDYWPRDDSDELSISEAIKDVLELPNWSFRTVADKELSLVVRALVKSKVHTTDPLRALLEQFVDKGAKVVAIIDEDGSYVGPVLPEQATLIFMKEMLTKRR